MRISCILLATIVIASAADAKQRSGTASQGFCTVRGSFVDVSGMEVRSIQAACNTSANGYITVCGSPGPGCSISWGAKVIKGTVIEKTSATVQRRQAQ